MDRIAARVWLAVATIVGLMGFASLSADDQVGDRAILERFVAERTALPRTLAARRSVAWGVKSDGEAFDHYEQAIACFESAFRGRGELQRGEILALRDRWSEAVALVSRGAHAAVLGTTGAYLPAGLWRKVMTAECGRLLDQQRDLDAVRTWLDFTTCQIDFAGADHMFHAMSMWQGQGVWLGCWHNERLAALSAPARAELARGLRVLDEQLRAGPDMLRYLERVARSWLDMRTPRFDLSERLHSWRHGFQPMRRYLHHVARLIENRALLLDRPRSGITRAEQLAMLTEECGRGSRGELLCAQLINREECGRRYQLARLRLLRMALQARAGERVTALRDPTGSGDIAIERRDGKLWFRAQWWRMPGLVREAP